MTGQRNREEVINTQLAILISRLGVTADAETIHVHGKHRPDVLFELRGLRVVIEGKFSDHPKADEIVLEDARRRVKSGIAHIAAAAVYPLKLRSAPTTRVIQTLESSRLKFRIVAETHESDWFEGTPSSLMDALRRAQEALTKDDIVEQTAKSLSMQLEGVSRLWIGQTGACDRLSKLLGIAPPKGEKSDKANDRRETAAKVSALVLANAFIFQEQLARSDERIDTLRKIEKSKDIVGATSKHWRWIWENINYVPIFQLGERVLDELPASPNTSLAVKSLLKEAQAICSQQAALRHDLMGRIYHWLLHNAKFLGTYYTSVSAATLLLKLAVGAKWQTDFASARELADFKIADLACGTGTLLMAAAQACTDRYINERAASDDRTLTEKDISVLHQTLMQNVLHGYDVLPSAVHLTASTLALLAPEVAFRNMNLFVMPMGLDHGTPRLGSLDFLNGNEIRTQFSLDDTHLDSVKTGVSKSAYVNATVPALDLCVMNPPFVSSRYGNQLFGSLPEERPYLQKELSRQARKFGVSATAGLGALFVPLADRHTKIGGRIAFVLPIALATGESWSAIRKLISDRYHLEIVVTSHDAQRPNFSENTDLSELLFIARRLRGKEKAGPTMYVGLWRNPRSIHEALDQASRIAVAIEKLRGKDRKTEIIKSSNDVLGEVTSLPAPIGKQNWTGAIFAQSELMKVHWSLDSKGELLLPRQSLGKKLPLCRLDELGVLGYDARDIADAFLMDRTSSQWSPYLAFLDHDASKVVCINQKPNAVLLARSEAIPGRKLKDADAVWAKSGNILLVSRLRTNTHRVIATGFNKAVLGNTWWAFKDSKFSKEQRKAFLLWINSSFSVLLYFGRRAITEGAWMQMKKPAWASMPVLNVGALSRAQLRTISSRYDDLAVKELAPIAQLDTDPVRKSIDDIFCQVFGLGDVSDMRALLAREPGLTARDINPRQPLTQEKHKDEDVESSDQASFDENR